MFLLIFHFTKFSRLNSSFNFDIVLSAKSTFSKVSHLTFNFVVVSFLDNFLSTIFSSSGIKFACSGVRLIMPKTGFATFSDNSNGFEVDKSSADLALLEG